MATLYITVAPPGSGKSTWAKHFAPTVKAVVVCPDQIRKEVTGNISDMSRDAYVWKLAKDRVRYHLSIGENTILDATNCKTKYRNAFINDIKMPEMLNLDIKFVLFRRVDPTICKLRIAGDLTAGIDRSAVPSHIVDTMYENYITSVKYLTENNADIIWVE